MKALCNLLLLAFAALVVSACASTTLTNAWFDPSYSGGPMRKILVVGVGGTLDTRRTLEDIFAQKLSATGTQGIPGYQFLPDDARRNEPGWNAGVAASGADGVLVVRLLGVDTRTQVYTTMVPGPGFYYGAYPGMWGPAMVPVPEVSQYQVAHVETTLFDTKSHRVVWGGTSQTFNPTTVRQETPAFADLIIGQLQARGVVLGSKP
jgi:uncharacterized protein DUF4136